MKNNPPTLHEFVQEVSTDGYFERARRRAKHRKSPWNLVLIPLVITGIPSTTYILFHIMWRLNLAMYPAHTGRLGEFWVKGLSFPSFCSSFLLFIPLLFASFPISMMFANVVVWLIPPARRALDREAEGIKWASFADSMSGLWIICRIMVPICMLLSFIGAATLANLR